MSQSYDVKAVSNNDQVEQLHFSETMSGSFSVLDLENRPRCQDPSTLAINVCIDIKGIDRFIADPLHKGTLSGTIDYSELAMGIKAHRGNFQLFVSSSEAGLKYMVYELAFTHNNQDYFFSGKKHLQLGSIFKLWYETTHLYSHLYRGENSQGELIASGVLSLGIWQLTKMVFSFKVSNSPSLCRSINSLRKFGQFFIQQLYKIYGPKFYK